MAADDQKRRRKNCADDVNNGLTSTLPEESRKCFRSARILLRGFFVWLASAQLFECGGQGGRKLAATPLSTQADRSPAGGRPSEPGHGFKARRVCSFNVNGVDRKKPMTSPFKSEPLLSYAREVLRHSRDPCSTILSIC
jgi:hypothetical protein